MARDLMCPLMQVLAQPTELRFSLKQSADSIHEIQRTICFDRLFAILSCTH